MIANKFFLLIFFLSLAGVSANVEFSQNKDAQSDFAKIFKESVDINAHGVLANNPEAVDCLLLDFAALIFDMVISLEKDIDKNKYVALRDGIYESNPDEFNRVKQERFAGINNLMWHSFADKTITQFKNIAFERLKSQLPIEKIKNDLQNKSEEEIKKYAPLMIKSMANKGILADIVNLWKTTSAGIPGDPKDAEVDCAMQ